MKHGEAEPNSITLDSVVLAMDSTPLGSTRSLFARVSSGNWEQALGLQPPPGEDGWGGFGGSNHLLRIWLEP